MTARKKKPDPQEKEDFKADIRRWADRINVKPKRVQVQSMTKKWASCSPSGRLTFAADLLDQPASFREAVIVHELLHLIVPNHGKLFKSMMGAYVPGWIHLFDSTQEKRPC
ncbi:MAG: M48 family metallopeptidase [Deltaproteobacteria bacterium]|nr:M48 family metallopeptidase [Deltaproteobacteria bacterium]